MTALSALTGVRPRGAVPPPASPPLLDLGDFAHQRVAFGLDVDALARGRLGQDAEPAAHFGGGC